MREDPTWFIFICPFSFLRLFSFQGTTYYVRAVFGYPGEEGIYEMVTRMIEYLTSGASSQQLVQEGEELEERKLQPRQDQGRLGSSRKCDVVERDETRRGMEWIAWLVAQREKTRRANNGVVLDNGTEKKKKERGRG